MNMYSEDIFTSKGFGGAKNVEPNFRSLLAEWIFIHAKAKGKGNEDDATDATYKEKKLLFLSKGRGSGDNIA